MRDEEVLIQIIQQNKVLMQVIDGVKSLGLDNYYIGAGCIVQTVWNSLTNRPFNYGITDIDIVYYDDQDLSFEAENSIVNRAANMFEDIPIALDIKNQARVHLWYKDKFGIELRPYLSLEDAIESWPTTATSLGVRQDEGGNWIIYAPFGLEDVFQMTLRANKRLISEVIYVNKVNKWLAKWPELKVIAWNQ